MLTCGECSEFLLDYLYGLLDEEEAERVRVHVTGCVACQAALAEAKDLQSMLAKAARKFSDVPMFQAPADELPSIVSLPLPIQPARLRGAAGRRWAVVGAAAGVLLAVGTSFAVYQRGLDQRQQALAEARKQIDTIDSKLVALAREPQRQQVEQDAKVQSLFQHTKLLGPATTQRGAANAYRLTTQTPLGHPAAAQVAVNVLNKSPGQETEQIQFNQTYQTAGELQFVVPPIPAPPGSKQRLLIETTNGIAKEVIDQPLTTVEPSYVTHIALNNSTFRPGDTVFFRTATLERFALTPVDRPLNLSFTLNRIADNKLEPVKKLHCTTGPGGVAGGDFLLPGDLIPGNYRLVLEETTPTPEQPFTVRGAARQLYVEAGVASAKNDAKAERSAPPAAIAEFFPEGGDLVAGLASRVYFRLQLPKDVPTNLVGIVEDNKQQAIAEIKIDGKRSQRNVVLGDFTFTPKTGEVYHFRLRTGNKQLSRWPLPDVTTKGVTLTVAQPVVAAGKPLGIQVRSIDRQPVLVLVNCRGRTVDQQIVKASDRPTDVTLEPVPGCHGVMSVTVYVEDGSNWRPVAERLVYRQSGAFLDLSPPLEKAYKPGASVNLGFESRNEKGELTPSWLHAMVIDQKALHPADAQETTLPTYFLLASSLDDPASLEDADILLSDSPDAAKALDLFLGTQGWRRFVPQPPGMPTLVAAGPAKDATAGQLAIFSAGTNLATVFDNYTKALQKERQDLGEEIEGKQTTLLGEREAADSRIAAAATALSAYQQLPMTWLRQSVAILLVVLIAVGAVLLLVGLIVAVRARSSPRVLLAGSFTVLLFGIVLFAGTSGLRTAEDDEAGPVLATGRPPGQVPFKKFALPQAEPGKAEAGKISVQVYAMSTPKQDPMDSKLFLGGREKVATAREELGSESKASAKGAKGKAAAKGGKGGGGFGGGGAQPPLQQSQLQNDATNNLQNPTNQAIPGFAGNNAIQMTNKAETTFLRQYANSAKVPALDQHGLILWQPLLTAENGTARVNFDLPGNAATYRLVIYGHTADGRLGSYRGTLDAK
jgi:uncharacterized membrane protein YgcG